MRTGPKLLTMSNMMLRPTSHGWIVSIVQSLNELLFLVLIKMMTLTQRMSLMGTALVTTRRRTYLTLVRLLQVCWSYLGLPSNLQQLSPCLVILWMPWMLRVTMIRCAGVVVGGTPVTQLVVTQNGYSVMLALCGTISSVKRPRLEVLLIILFVNHIDPNFVSVSFNL